MWRNRKDVRWINIWIRGFTVCWIIRVRWVTLVVDREVYIGGVIRMIGVRVVRDTGIRERVVAPPTTVGGPEWRRTGRKEDTLLIARHVILCLAVVICLTIFLRGYNKQHNAFRQEVQLFPLGVWCGLAFLPLLFGFSHFSSFSFPHTLFPFHLGTLHAERLFTLGGGGTGSRHLLRASILNIAENFRIDFRN